MKKMLMMILVAGVASLAQAVSIEWSVTADSLPAGVGFDDVQSVKLVAVGDIGHVTQEVADAAATLADRLTPTGNWIDAAGVWDITDMSTGDYYIVLFDNNGNYLASANAITIADNGVGVGPNPPTDTSWSMDSADSWSSAGWQEVVPEPTSLALLALGVAGVGLRRRVKKQE